MGRAWSTGPKKFKTQSSADWVMATVFWDAKSVIMLDFLLKRSTITGVYYANCLDQLRTAVSGKRRGKLSKGVLFILFLFCCNRTTRKSTLAKYQWML